MFPIFVVLLNNFMALLDLLNSCICFQVDDIQMINFLPAFHKEFFLLGAFNLYEFYVFQVLYCCFGVVTSWHVDLFIRVWLVLSLWVEDFAVYDINMLLGIILNIV